MADDTVEVLILDLLEWLTVRDRTYEEVMDAWRTSCRRLPVWEDANGSRADRARIGKRPLGGQGRPNGTGPARPTYED
jgi:hypothetical protein